MWMITVCLSAVLILKIYIIYVYEDMVLRKFLVSKHSNCKSINKPFVKWSILGYIFRNNEIVVTSKPFLLKLETGAMGKLNG